jgi:histidine triad (HIT) family protein
MAGECIFCLIAHGSGSADVVYDGGDTVFFRDINPKARVHIIGIPKIHLASLAGVTADHHELMGKLLHDAVHVAEEMGLRDSGYRVISNIGPDSGQVVPHLHIHILGGESLGPLRA